MISSPESILFLIMTAFYFFGASYANKRFAKNRTVRDDEYLSCLAMARQCSVYEIFQHAGSDWSFSSSKVKSDFNQYLKEGFIPRYVSVFARKNVLPEDLKMYVLMSRGW